MTSRILHELTTDKRYQHLPLPVLEEIYPRELVCQVLDETNSWEQRERTLNHVFMIYLLISWTLLPLVALKQVCGQLTALLRWCSSQRAAREPSASALCYRRRTLGVRPLQLLMRYACQPLCQPDTPGAFRFGRRLIAIDSKLFDVSETEETDWTFRGRTRDEQPRSHSVFPQVRLVSALEIGSHAHVGAAVVAGYRSEMSVVEQLLSFLPPQSLILQDSGFRAAWWQQRLRQQGHHSIVRLQANDYPCTGARLSDGSYLVQAHGCDQRPLKEPLTLRIIEYRLAPHVAQALAQLRKSRVRSGTCRERDPQQVYRLATTLLDPVAAPAKEIATCYHERWELELVYDEVQEQQLSTPRLLSKSSQGVLQEVWALVLGHYALRAWMMQSARQVDGLDVDRLSFREAVAVLGTALVLSQSLALQPVEQWKPRLLEDLRATGRLLPPRRLRCYPRVVKVALHRFSVKRESDVALVLEDKTLSWEDLIVPVQESLLTDPLLI